MNDNIISFPRKLSALQSLADIVGMPPPHFRCSPGPPTAERWAEFILINLMVDGFTIVPFPDKR